MGVPQLIFDQIGINLSDPVFRGEYHGRQVHDSDMDDIIQRARDVGCEKFMVTGSDLEESRRVMELSRNYCESSRSPSCLALLTIPFYSWLLLWNCRCASLPGKGL